MLKIAIILGVMCSQIPDLLQENPEEGFVVFVVTYISFCSCVDLFPLQDLYIWKQIRFKTKDTKIEACMLTSQTLLYMLTFQWNIFVRQ